MSRAGLSWLMAGTMLAAAGPAVAETEFIVRLYNAGTEGGMTLADGSTQTPLLSWGVYAVHKAPNALFTPGQAAGDTGLEELAEDGIIDKMAAWLAGRGDLVASGELKARAVRGEATLHPGGLYRAVFKANPGDSFSFAIMLEQSNDGFYAPGPEGIALFDDAGNPISEDVTGQVLFWDAGTEVNQPPGLGPDVGVNEKGPNQGASENGVVQLLNDGFDYPAVKDVIKVTVKPR
jgi:hypothetical protein